MSRDFLKRWSERKLEEVDEAPTPVDLPAPDERPEDEILEELGLRDPDDMGADDDFSAFMGEAIPARLRTRALRRLWTLNPTLANLDGLVEYGEDYTDAATVVENLQTVYQVGKGMVQKVLEADIEDEVELPEVAESLEPTEPEAVLDEPVAYVTAEAEPAEDLEPPMPRRMRVEFEDV